MISAFSTYFLFAALVEIGLLLFVRAKGVQSQYLYGLLITFISLNLCILGFSMISPENEFIIELLLRLFYVGLFISAGCFLSYGIQVSEATKELTYTAQIENGVWLVALCGSLLVVFSDEIVQGYRHITHSVTAIQGNNYWIVVVHSQLALLTAGVVLIREWWRLPAGRQRQRCFYALIAYLVHIVCAIIIALIMRFGSDINFSTTFPLSSVISLSLLIFGELKYAERKLERMKRDQGEMSDNEMLIDIFDKYEAGAYSFNEATEKVEYLLLIHAYKKHNGNMMRTAEAIGLGRSTLYKKVNKYGLK